LIPTLFSRHEVRYGPSRQMNCTLDGHAGPDLGLPGVHIVTTALLLGDHVRALFKYRRFIRPEVAWLGSSDSAKASARPLVRLAKTSETPHVNKRQKHTMSARLSEETCRWNIRFGFIPAAGPLQCIRAAGQARQEGGDIHRIIGARDGTGLAWRRWTEQQRGLTHNSLESVRLPHDPRMVPEESRPAYSMLINLCPSQSSPRPGPFRPSIVATSSLADSRCARRSAACSQVPAGLEGYLLLRLRGHLPRSAFPISCQPNLSEMSDFFAAARRQASSEERLSVTAVSASGDMASALAGVGIVD